MAGLRTRLFLLWGDLRKNMPPAPEAHPVPPAVIWQNIRADYFQSSVAIVSRSDGLGGSFASCRRGLGTKT
jgi:hypothetical protein